jgi:hypothetical protein
MSGDAVNFGVFINFLFAFLTRVAHPRLCMLLAVLQLNVPASSMQAGRF